MTEPRIATLQGQYAGFVSRLFAFVADSAIITSVSVVAGWASVSLLLYLGVDVRDCPPLDSDMPIRDAFCHFAQWAGVAAASLFPIGYGLFFWSTTGQTPGKAFMGVRVVRVDGGPMTVWTSVMRLFGYAVSFATLGLGFYVMLADNRRQGWHDKIARTCVIYSWPARQNAHLIARVRRMFRPSRPPQTS